MNYLLKILTISVFTSCSFSLHAKDSHKTEVIFTQMKTMVGTWQKQDRSNDHFEISFELIANETVLVETWLRNGNSHSITVYHLNNKALMATHYCPQGNQPRMLLTSNSTINNISFKYIDATNLASINESHQHSVGFQFDSKSNTLIRKEVYTSKKGDEPSELKLIRKTKLNV